jgi:RNA polymerase sigma factor (sigma-70 family)
MADPSTRPSLLVRIRDARDRVAWREFADLYAPLIFRYAQRQGLQEADAADVTQDVLQAVASRAKEFKYNPECGFRGWLYKVARSKLINFIARRRKQDRGSGDSQIQELLANQAAPHRETADWDRDYERRLFHWAAERLRGRFHEPTWKAFWQTAVEGREAKEVAQRLGMSIGGVYVAKSRVQARLREEIHGLENEHPPGEPQ